MKLDTLAENENDKVLYSGDWVELRLKDGWYEYLKNKGEGAVEVLAYDPDAKKFLCRYENCPVHGPSSTSIDPTSLSGTIETGDSALQTAKKELMEESGYDMPIGDFIEYGYIHPGKATDTKCFLFFIEMVGAADDKKHIGEGDGTEGEKGSYCVWQPISKIMELTAAGPAMTLLRAGISVDGDLDE